jgi:saccharopine dehydrogenase-like NADP-dependent oxidoreductase
VSPRDVVAAVLPDPLTLGDKMSGKTCAGLYVTGKGKDGKPTGPCTSTTCVTTTGA